MGKKTLGGIFAHLLSGFPNTNEFYKRFRFELKSKYIHTHKTNAFRYFLFIYVLKFCQNSGTGTKQPFELKHGFIANVQPLVVIVLLFFYIYTTILEKISWLTLVTI